MAEIILSAVLPIVFEKLASIVANKFADRSKEIDSELKKWNASLVQISKLLSDAAEREIKDESVKHWLNRLRHLAYDIDDELDALATDAAMHCELTHDQEPPRNIASKVKKLIPTCCTASSSSSPSSTTKVHYKKLNEITTELQKLYDEKDDLGLTIKGKRSSQDKNRSYQTSLLTPGIVGRDAEKDVLLQKLLPDHDEATANQYNFSIVPIVGMGGMGKTTLARLLYNEPKVEKYFELKAWVCVSDEFSDSFKISKLIYESVGGDQEKKFQNQDMLQQALNNKLSGKRFLLVLDDVWSEKIEDWDTLVPPLYAVAPGSKIIMTTRTEKLTQQLGCDDPFYLNKLSDGDALSLLAQHALGANNFTSFPKLRSYGEGIVRKCGALPLAIKSLGSLLRSKKKNEEKWKEMLESEIWSLEDDAGILPALRLSYLHLSAHLKHLFAYSCLFPKDYVFEKEDLILLWMAEGFLLGSRSSLSMECLGEEYFDELLSRSFFQHVPDDESLFVMHDLMNELATSVAGEFFTRLDVNLKNTNEKLGLKKYRHMSFVREELISLKKFKTIEKPNALRTFLVVPVVARDDSWKRFYPSQQILVDLLPSMPLLRALCLSKLEIDEIPECVGGLKHLRYLNVSLTPITHLPDSVCNLYNLQTLIVFGCEELNELPKNFLKLKNLRHFDVRDTPLLKNMSLGVGEMKNLQTLSKISIREENKFPTSGLRNLNNLRRKVCIDGLDKLQNIDQAGKLNLSQMKLSELVMEWSDDFDGSRKQSLETEILVLDVLKPHSSNLKNLRVVSYGGTKFPKWVGDSSFCKLNVVSLSNCRNCLFMPPLGQLPSLKQLFIDSMDYVKEVGSGLFGNEFPAFPSLEILSFCNMRRWEEWLVNAVFPRLEELRINNCPHMERWEVNADVIVFPCLEKLDVSCCSNLVKVSLEALPSLRVLKINYCNDGVLKSLVGVASSVTNMTMANISGLSEEVWGDIVQYLGVLEKLSIECCYGLKNLWGSEEADACKEVLGNLKQLNIFQCEKLVRIGRGGEKDEERSNLPTSLRMLKIMSCDKLKHLSCPDSIETLDIQGCRNLEHLSCPANTIQKLTINACGSVTVTSASFPAGGGEGGWKKLKSLEVLRIWSMGPENLISMTKATCFLRKLVNLEIEYCGGIESFPDLKDLVSLKHLRIYECKSMDGPPPLVGSGVWPSNLDSLDIGRLKRPISEWGPLPPSLVQLNLWGVYNGYQSEEEEEDVKSFPTSSLLPHSLSSSLTSLGLGCFKRMERISEGLQHLTSLQHLSIWMCPRLKDLPETLLPTLLSLEIRNGLNEELKEKMTSRGKSYGPFLSHIPKLEVFI
uniref:putative disease resistance RPP13-like protein 1 n=1 Tax=Erigeron canadensis TaxID=72917 RepID=UPI001CB9C0B4|nr:putative disease resistance RPP13-like protein 1 [Erigeron canadensis]